MGSYTTTPRKSTPLTTRTMFGSLDADDGRLIALSVCLFSIAFMRMIWETYVCIFVHKLKAPEYWHRYICWMVESITFIVFTSMVLDRPNKDYQSAAYVFIVIVVVNRAFVPISAVIVGFAFVASLFISFTPIYLIPKIYGLLGIVYVVISEALLAKLTIPFIWLLLPMDDTVFIITGILLLLDEPLCLNGDRPLPFGIKPYAYLEPLFKQNK